MKYFNIFKAHRIAGLPLALWSSSGYGKTAMVKAYAIEEHMDIYPISATTLDPLTLILPKVDEATGGIKTYPCSWLMKCCKATAEEPIVLFLDEINRVRNVQVLNLLTELLLERKVDEHRLSKHCQIIAACNLSEEDHGVLEFPDAVVQRFTHIFHAPPLSEIIENMVEDLAKDVLREGYSLKSKPMIPTNLELKDNPRQIDHVCALAKTGVLSDYELGVVARGRCGIEAGNALKQKILDILRKEERKLPSKVEPKNYEKISAVENSGQVIEVASLLREKGQVPRFVADYLIKYALPETCRSLVEAKFSYEYESDVIPTQVNGQPICNPVTKEPIRHSGLDWKVYALMLGKLNEGKKVSTAEFAKATV